jgi:hypothetical protein
MQIHRSVGLNAQNVAGILPNLFHYSLGPSSCFGISQRELKANVPSHDKFFRFVNVAILLVPLTSMLFPSVLLLLLCFFIHYFLTSALLPHYRKSCKQRVPHYCLSKQASKLLCSVAGCAAPTVCDGNCSYRPHRSPNFAVAFTVRVGMVV